MIAPKKTYCNRFLTLQNSICTSFESLGGGISACKARNMQTTSNHTTDGTNARLDNPSVRQPLHWAQHDANLGTIRNSTPDGLHTVHSHVPNLYNSWWQSQLHNAIFRHNRITNLGSTVHDRTSGIFNAVENAGG